MRLGVLMVVAAALLIGAPPAAAKEGVKATLTTKIPLDAAPGTKLEVGWTLAYLDDNGRRQPFGAGEVFVRLLSASGARAETTFVDGSGSFIAKVAVPEGGIGDVRIGLRGYSDGRTSDMLFPITNDPLPGPPRPLSGEPALRGDDGSNVWIAVLVGGSALTTCALAVFVARRKRRALATPS
jgi:hypothetical protein